MSNPSNIKPKFTSRFNSFFDDLKTQCNLDSDSSDCESDFGCSDSENESDCESSTELTQSARTFCIVNTKQPQTQTASTSVNQSGITPSDLTPLAATPTGYSPAQIRAAYGVDKLLADGTNQTIAVIGAYYSPNIIADFKTFDTYYNLGNPNALSVYSFATTSNVNAGWALELSMDVQWIHAIAPKAKILLVQAKSAGLTDLLAAITYATSNGATVVSMSWGAGEFSTEANYDTYFTKTGVCFCASSGDTGGIVNWPSVSPRVLSVGGTSLTLNGLTRVSETAWTGAGGGSSAYIAVPSYQNVLGGAKRQCPDIAAIADPAVFGVSVYCSTPYNGTTGWYSVGGTSASVLIVAGTIALVNQLRTNLSKPTLSTNQVQTYLYGLNSGSYSTDFYDIVNGTAGTYTAKTGYDNITGLGSPNCTPSSVVVPAAPVILSGGVDPSIGVGVNGNYYINLTTGSYYLKSGGVWVSKGSIVTTVVSVGTGGGFVNDLCNNL